MESNFAAESPGGLVQVQLQQFVAEKANCRLLPPLFFLLQETPTDWAYVDKAEQVDMVKWTEQTLGQGKGADSS